MLARARSTPGAGRAGRRSTRCHCAAIPEPLQARELFGCADGAYPALPDAYDGALARAAGGTLLLEGDRRARPAPVRDAALERARGRTLPRARATRAERRAAARGSIATRRGGAADARRSVSLRIRTRSRSPPLAERREDVLPLAAHFLRALRRGGGSRRRSASRPRRAPRCSSEPWPGNVAELRERVRQAVRLAGSGAVSAEALMLAARRAIACRPSRRRSAPSRSRYVRGPAAALRAATSAARRGSPRRTARTSTT